MADEKISELTELAAAPASDDQLPIVDTSVTTTKRISIANFFAWLLATARTFTVAPVIETGAAGAAPLIIRQTGGVAGTDELCIGHTGSVVEFEIKDNSPIQFQQSGGAPVAMIMVAEGHICTYTNFVSSTTLSPSNCASSLSSDLLLNSSSTINFSDTTNATNALSLQLKRVASGVLSIGNGSNAAGQLELPQSADIGSPSSNCARIGSEDDAGTAKIVLVDEAGNEVIPTPHPETAPPELYRETPGVEHICRDLNRYRDSVEWVNLTAMAKALEILTGDKFYIKEDLATFNARTGKNKTVRDWDADQAAKQTAEVLARMAEIEAAAKVDADYAKAVAAYEELSAAEKAKRPAPVKAEVQQPREAKDVRKAKPAWLKAE